MIVTGRRCRIGAPEATAPRRREQQPPRAVPGLFPGPAHPARDHPRPVAGRPDAPLRRREARQVLLLLFDSWTAYQFQFLCTLFLLRHFLHRHTSALLEHLRAFGRCRGFLGSEYSNIFIKHFKLAEPLPAPNSCYTVIIYFLIVGGCFIAHALTATTHHAICCPKYHSKTIYLAGLSM